MARRSGVLDAGTLLSPHATDAGRARGEMPWFVVANLRLLGVCWVGGHPGAAADAHLQAA